MRKFTYAVNRHFWVKMLSTVSLLVAASTGYAEIWRFGLIGDTPYSDYERAELPKMIAAMADSPVELIAHIGDIKSGRDRCDDALFEDRYQLFNASRVPFVFIPGDNEWTDCDRLSNGNYEPTERLARLRQIFWSQAESLGVNRIKLAQQPGNYPEQARFRLGPVLFVTLNVPGSDNNWGLQEAPRAEYLERNPQVLAWLRDSFALARRQKLAGIVLLFQANPGFKHFSQGLPHRAYRDFLAVLHQETLSFKGEVVAVHGDTHSQQIDHPLRDARGKRLKNFTRIETFGYPLMGWIRGIIDTDAPELFRFEVHPWPPGSRH